MQTYILYDGGWPVTIWKNVLGSQNVDENDNRIHPTTDRIVCCYRHWKKLYNKLRMHDPSIRWQQILPNSVLEKLEDTIVVVDDLMEARMNDATLMSMFTEGSHHRNTIVFIVQKFTHQGRRSRSLNLNTQYLVLYKTPRYIQQIKTIAQQMYPTDWRRFLAYFEAETSRPYGKVIIELHSAQHFTALRIRTDM